MTTIEGHSLVARSLKDLGVTHVYCLAGTPIRETFSKCAELGMRPILDLDMRLGEGSGAALSVSVLRAALACHLGMATFDEAGVDERG